MLQGPGAGRPPIKVLEGGRRRLLSPREVADELGVSRWAVYALVERGELRHVRISNSIRVAPDDLAKFVAARQSGGGPADGGGLVP